MSGLSKARVVVAGGGALGSSIALELAFAGAGVTLVDPGAGLNASGVAAGMLAPALECALDPEGGLDFEQGRAARDLWPGVAEQLGGEIGLTRDGALWRDLPGVEPRVAEIADRLRAVGAHVAPAAADDPDALFTAEDWRLNPTAALRALGRALAAWGGQILAARAEAFEGGQVRLSSGAPIAADHLIVATGAEGRGLAPELEALIPIKGQILKYPDLIPPPGAPTIRCAGGYATGGLDGLCVGATMEVGRTDRRSDPETTARLHALAVQLYPGAATMTPLALTGVRAATLAWPPLIAASQRPGVIVAAGVRRNGWLLAPLAARWVRAYLSGEDPAPFGRYFGQPGVARG